MPTPRNRPELKLLLGVEARHREQTSPRPARREPQPLPWFTIRQRQIWDEVVVELRDMGTLSNADRYEMAAYVALVSHFELAVDQLNADPVYVQHNRYTISVAALLSAVDRLTMRCTKLAAQLGLNPHARAQIHGRDVRREDTEAAQARDLYA